MLRITVLDTPEVITFKLEGKLSGQWVQVLEECWQRVVTRHGNQVFHIDLTDVTYVDDSGRSCLASLHGRGVRFTAADCLTKAIVADLNQEYDSNFPS